MATDFPPLSPRKRLAGIGLILATLSWLLVLPFIPLDSNKAISLPVQAPVGAQALLVFFGYPGCGTICPTTLQVLREVYQTHRQPDGRLGVVFVNLRPLDLPGIALDYAHSFHPEFHAWQLPVEQLEPLMRELGAYVIDQRGNEMLHTGYVYLLRKTPETWRLRALYNRPETLPTAFAEHVAEIL